VRGNHGRLREEQALFRVRQVHARHPLAFYLGRKNLVSAALRNPVIVVFRIKGVG